MSHILWRFELRPASEIDGNQSCNVRHRKVWPADELMIGKLSIQPTEEMLDTFAPPLG
jgi:hypothetical protein